MIEVYEYSFYEFEFVFNLLVWILLAAIAAFVIFRLNVKVKLPYYLFFFFSLIQILNITDEVLSSYNAQTILDNNKCNVVSGFVNVTRTSGRVDFVSIGSVSVKVMSGGSPPGYNKNSGDGGILKDGIWAQICEFEGKILRIKTREFDIN